MVHSSKHPHFITDMIYEHRGSKSKYRSVFCCWRSELSLGKCILIEGERGFTTRIFLYVMCLRYRSVKKRNYRIKHALPIISQGPFHAHRPDRKAMGSTDVLVSLHPVTSGFFYFLYIEKSCVREYRIP